MQTFLDKTYYATPNYLAIDCGDLFREAVSDLIEVSNGFDIRPDEIIGDFFENTDIENAVDDECNALFSVLQWECNCNPKTEIQKQQLTVQTEAIVGHTRAMLETLLEECQRYRLFSNDQRMNWYGYYRFASPGVLVLSKRSVSELVDAIDTPHAC